MLNKFAAALLIGLSVALTGLAGWGLIYLPDRMKDEARRNIANLREVLARDAPSLSLTHGDISANPFTAHVSVAKFSLGRPGEAALKAEALGFTIDPFTRRLSAVDATTLRLDDERARLRIDAMRLTGVTPGVLMLLEQAARGQATADGVIRHLEIPGLALSGINVTAPSEGEVNIRRIAIENLKNGIVGRFSIEGLNLYSRAGPNPGEFSVDKAALAGLNFGAIATAVSRRDPWPRLTAPMIEGLSFDGIRVMSDEANLSIGRGALEAVYGTNEAGRPYARKAQFLIEGIVVKPAGRDSKLRDFLAGTGLSRIDADVRMVSAGDHKAHTLAIEDMSFRMAGLADITFKLAMANLPAAIYELSIRPEDASTLMGEIGSATLTGGSLTVSNGKFIQLALAQTEKQQGLDPMAMIRAMIALARQDAERRGQVAFRAWADEIERFLADPKTLKISIAPGAPVPLGVFMGGTGINDAAWWIRTLGLKVEANR